MYRDVYVVIEPASHGYAWVALVKEYFTAMVLRISSPMPQGGSWKGGTCEAWLSEPAKKDLASCRFPAFPKLIYTCFYVK